MNKQLTLFPEIEEAKKERLLELSRNIKRMAQELSPVEETIPEEIILDEEEDSDDETPEPCPEWDRAGSVSSGTMLASDLIPSFMSELEELNPLAARRIEQEYSDFFTGSGDDPEYEPDYDSEEAGYLVEALFDALNDEAHDGYYFGAHPGDGADYGFWCNEEDM